MHVRYSSLVDKGIGERSSEYLNTIGVMMDSRSAEHDGINPDFVKTKLIITIDTKLISISFLWMIREKGEGYPTKKILFMRVNWRTKNTTTPYFPLFSKPSQGRSACRFKQNRPITEPSLHKMREVVVDFICVRTTRDRRRHPATLYPPKIFFYFPF